MEDETVEEREDDGVAADAERQRQHRHRRESRPADELAKRVAQILGESFHGASPRRRIDDARRRLAAANRIRQALIARSLTMNIQNQNGPDRP